MSSPYVATSWRDVRDDREKYQRYLNSRKWAVKRNAVHARCGGKCERCHWNKVEQVHHLTYARKYNEDMADLQGICRGCHEFTHGKSDVDPIASAKPPRLLGRFIESIYLAGTCGPHGVGDYEDCHGGLQDHHNWRADITDAFFVGHEQPVPESREGPGQEVVLSSGKIIRYSGPHIEYEHGCYTTDKHGGSSREPIETYYNAMQGIADADLIFAWIDCLDCYGTIAEIGYAYGNNKRVVIAGPERFSELWFVYAMARKTWFGTTSPRAALDYFFENEKPSR